MESVHRGTGAPLFFEPGSIAIAAQCCRVPTLPELRALLTSGRELRRCVPLAHDSEGPVWTCDAFQLDRIYCRMGGHLRYSGHEFQTLDGMEYYCLPASYGVKGFEHQASPEARHYALLLLHHPLLLEEPKPDPTEYSCAELLRDIWYHATKDRRWAGAASPFGGIGSAPLEVQAKFKKDFHGTPEWKQKMATTETLLGDDPAHAPAGFQSLH